MKNLILIDRDGTLIYDKKYYLGKTDNWKNKVKILPNVIRGLKVLSKLKDTHVYMIKNQPGVAVKEFPKLTKKRANDVAKYIVKKINGKDNLLEGYFLCPHANSAYVNKRKEYTFDKKYTHKCNCLKPKLGMVFMALKKEGFSKKNTNIYVIGDREGDVQTAVNVNGTGILVPFENEIQEKKKVNQLKGKKYKAKNFYEACTYIKKRTK